MATPAKQKPALKTVLIVGGDSPGTASKKLDAKVIHWNGRRSQVPKYLPRVDMVVVLAGYVQHDLMLCVKRMAKKAGVPVRFLRRGLAELKLEAAVNG